MTPPVYRLNTKRGALLFESFVDLLEHCGLDPVEVRDDVEGIDAVFAEGEDA